MIKPVPGVPSPMPGTGTQATGMVIPEIVPRLGNGAPGMVLSRGMDLQVRDRAPCTGMALELHSGTGMVLKVLGWRGMVVKWWVYWTMLLEQYYVTGMAVLGTVLQAEEC